MFWSLVRPDRILPPITSSAAVTTSLEADESTAGIIHLPANATCGPWPVARFPQGPGWIEENSQPAETGTRRRLEKVIWDSFTYLVESLEPAVNFRHAGATRPHPPSALIFSTEVTVGCPLG